MRNLVIFILLITVFACKSRQNLTDAPVTDESLTNTMDKGIREPHYCEEISNAQELDFERSQIAATTILDYKLHEACICVVYQYSGCEKAKSFLSWDGHWPSEFEPVISMQLGVVNPGMCDMLLTDSACFSIKKLSFGGDKVSVTLNEPQNRIDIDFTEY